MHLAEELGRRGLVEASLFLQAQDAQRFEQAQRSYAVGIRGVFRLLERNLDVALRREVVELVGLRLLDHARQARGIRHVAVVQDEAAIADVRVLVEVIDAVGVEERRPALDAVDDVALAEQQLGEVGAVLPGDAGDQSDFSLFLHGS